MKKSDHLTRKKLITISFLLFISISYSQILPGVYQASKGEGEQMELHRLVIGEDYLVHSVYQEKPANFIRTYGGYYEHADGLLHLSLEFKSDFNEEDSRDLEIKYELQNNKLNFLNEGLEFVKAPELKQDLDGYWLFATRGPDTGQERRGDDKPRKTLKVLADGTFQWIAYHTETFKFSGTGGGKYTANDGNYTESIEFFSRDNSRAGAELKFQYERKGSDWHHTGKNSRGEPMYEIWSLRWEP